MQDVYLIRLNFNEESVWVVTLGLIVFGLISGLIIATFWLWTATATQIA